MVTLDMEVAFEDGELELVLLDEANERELEASEATLVGGAQGTLSLCQIIQLMGSGRPWRCYYVLPSGRA